MINRVATFTQYQNLTSNLMRKQGQINVTNEQLATGKRMQTAGDDPVASVSTQNYKQQLVQFEQFQKSITLAGNRLNSLETALTDAEGQIDLTKQRVIGMINGAMTGDDRGAFTFELETMYDSMLDLANSQDEGGNFMFAGNQFNNKPFVADASGTVKYMGDDGHREARIDTSVFVQTSQPGEQVFMGIENPFGDYRPNFAGLQSGSTLNVQSATNKDPNDTNEYRVAFVDNGTGGLNYELYDDTNGVQLATGAYDATKGIQYKDPTAGSAIDLDFQFDGDIKPDDEVSLNPGKTFSLFDTIKSAIDYSQYPTSSAEAQAGLQQTIDDLTAAYVHMNQRRSEVGVGLKQLDTFEEQHKDFELAVNNAKGSLEDIDYSKAVIDMNQNMVAMQASQAAFNKTKELSLFNYL